MRPPPRRGAKATLSSQRGNRGSAEAARERWRERQIHWDLLRYSASPASVSEQPPLRHYFEVLGRQALVLAVIVAFALAAAALAMTLQKPIYRASMGVVVGQGGGVFQPEFGGSVEPFTLTLSNLLRTHVVAD